MIYRFFESKLKVFYKSKRKIQAGRERKTGRQEVQAMCESVRRVDLSVSKGERRRRKKERERREEQQKAANRMEKESEEKKRRGARLWGWCSRKCRMLSILVGETAGKTRRTSQLTTIWSLEIFGKDYITQSIDRSPKKMNNIRLHASAEDVSKDFLSPCKCECSEFSEIRVRSRICQTLADVRHMRLIIIISTCRFIIVSTDDKQIKNSNRSTSDARCLIWGQKTYLSHRMSSLVAMRQILDQSVNWKGKSG